MDSAYGLHYESANGEYAQSSTVPNERRGDEEVPFLAKRLFSLGLEGWYRNNFRALSVRAGLRDGWGALIDDEGKAQNIVAIDSTKKEGVGEDIAILRVIGNSEQEFLTPDRTENSYINSGPFEMTKPSVFFERLDSERFQEFNDTRCEVDNNTELFAYHFNKWPDENPRNKEVALISNPGYRSAEAALKECKRDWKRLDKCMADGTIGHFNYQNCLKTTLDVRSASSGGSMETTKRCWYNDCEGENCPEGKVWVDRYKGVRVVKGVIHGVKYKNRPGESDENAAERAANWFEDETNPMGQTVLKVGSKVTEQGHASLEEAALVTALSESVEISWLDRDKDYPTPTPHNPNPTPNPDQYGPNQPSNPDLESKFVCLELDSAEHCVKYQVVEVSNGVYPLPGGDNKTDVEAGPIPEHLLGGPKDEAFENTTPPDTGRRESMAMCSFNVPDAYKEHLPDDFHFDRARIRKGMVIGFMGGASHSSIPNDGKTIVHLTDLFNICTPWTEASWFDNWNFTHIHGEHLGSKSPGRKAFFPIWWRKLYHAVREVYELRKDSSGSSTVEHVRPPSMKTCPPNYHMKGVTFYHGKKSGSDLPILLGIKYLRCARMETRYEKILASTKPGFGAKWMGNMPLYITVPLETNVSQNFTLDGAEFSLSAHIGSSKAQTGNETWTELDATTTSCPNIERGSGSYPGTVVGFRYGRQSNGMFDTFRLLCDVAPGTKVTTPPAP